MDKDRERSYYVVKSNELIRKSKYSLTILQQKLVLYAISRIRIEDEISKEYEFTVKELCEVCGIPIDTQGVCYKRLESDLDILCERKKIPISKTGVMTFSWFGDYIYDKGYIRLTFSSNMRRYLFQQPERLQEQISEARRTKKFIPDMGYTQYYLEQGLVFKFKHSLRIFEILRSHITRQEIDNYDTKTVEVGFQELQELLEVNYTRFQDFKNRVLDKAVKEINSCNEDIHIEYETIRRGQKVISIRFIITTAHCKQALEASKVKKTRLK